MKKLLALLLAAMMVFALCACGGGNKAEETAPEAPAAPAAAPDAAAPGAAAEGDFDTYKAYVIAYAAAGAPTEEEAKNVEDMINGCATVEDLEAIPQLTVLFANAGVLHFDEWVAAGCPEADTSNMTMGDPSASGEGSGEPTGEPPAA